MMFFNGCGIWWNISDNRQPFRQMSLAIGLSEIVSNWMNVTLDIWLTDWDLIE